MLKIDELYDLIYLDESTKDASYFLTIVEPNIELLLKTDFGDYKERYKTTRLISDFAIAKCKVGEFHTALPYLNNSIFLFETDEKLMNKDLLDESLYTALIMKRGETLYKLRKYKAAFADFKKLTQKYPNNKSLNNWCIQCRRHSLEYLEWLFIILIVINLLLKLIFNFHSIFLSITIIICVVGILAIFLYRNSIK
ncbi:MAG: hypothetical protein PHV20_02750 [Bacteroidales bacterium]|nr:hypothetical protein [Bacteroidales bacterium]